MYPAWFAQLISLNIALYVSQPLKQDTAQYAKIKDMLEAAIIFAEEANARAGKKINKRYGRPADEGDNSLVDAGRFDGDLYGTGNGRFYPYFR